MGMTLSVAKFYRVEYDQKSYFNGDWKNEINDLIRLKCETSYFIGSDYDSDSDIIVNKDEFINLINWLKEMTDEEFKNECDVCCGSDRAELISALENILDSADPDNSFMKLSWF